MIFRDTLYMAIYGTSKGSDILVGENFFDPYCTVLQVQKTTFTNKDIVAPTRTTNFAPTRTALTHTTDSHIDL